MPILLMMFFHDVVIDPGNVDLGNALADSFNCVPSDDIIAYSDIIYTGDGSIEIIHNNVILVKDNWNYNTICDH